MEAIEPAYGADTLLLIAAAAVALLLFLIMKVKLHAFVALVLVSVLTALAAGIPVGDIPDALSFGFSSTLGSVALLVGFGVMIGRLLEVTGGAQVLADTLIGRFGEKRAPLALGVAALLFGFPIFFDAGLVVFLPIIMTVARRFGGSLLLYALPAAGAFAAMHALVPPHPGPVAAAEVLGASIGLTLLVGAPVAFLSWYVGAYLVSQVIGRRVHVDVPTSLFGEINGGRDTDDTHRRPATTTVHRRRTGSATRPDPHGPVVRHGPRSAAAAVRVDLVQHRAQHADDRGRDRRGRHLGAVPQAARQHQRRPADHGDRRRLRAGSCAKARWPTSPTILDKALGPICAIILITGAGGMFGGVLRLSGIGDALSGSLSNLGFSLILQAFLIATLLRVAQGSATVALTTTAGLLAAAVADADLSNLQLTALVIAIAAGATVLSHVNDSGFWLVSRFFEMDVKTTFKTWTVMETTLGLSAFVLSLLLWVVG